MQTLRLTIPQTQNTPPAIMGNRLGDLKRWLAALPMVDSQRALAQLLAGLQEFNRSNVESELRWEAMELLWPVAEQLIAATRKKYAFYDLPLQEHERADVAAVWQLHTELVYGYKLLFFAGLKHARGRQKKRLPRVVFRALRGISNLLLEHYLYYYAEPVKTWSEFYTLYRYGRQQGWHQRALEPQGVSPRSIDEVFLQTILLAAVVPYRLMRREVLAVSEQMAAWGHHGKVYEPSADWQYQDELYIDLLQDRPPGCQPLGAAQAHPDAIRIMDISGVVEVAREHYDRLEQDHQSGGQGFAERKQRELLVRLLSGWGGRKHRGSDRQTVAGRVAIQVGLPECVKLYHGRPEQPDQSGAQPLSLSLVSTDEEPWQKSRPVGEPVIKGGAASFEIDDPNQDVWASSAAIIAPEELAPQHQEQALIDPYIVSQINVSAGGMALDLKGISQQDAQRLRLVVGELVAVRRLASSDRWQLGVVRWMRLLQHGDGNIGVMTLAAAAEAVTVRAVSGRGVGGDFVPALLVDPEKQANRVRLITPSITFDEGTTLVMVQQGENHRLHLSTLHELSDTFAMFDGELLT